MCFPTDIRWCYNLVFPTFHGVKGAKILMEINLGLTACVLGD